MEGGITRAKVLLLGETSAITRALPAGIPVPVRPNTLIRSSLGACLWLGPHRRLLLLDDGTADDGPDASVTAEAVRALRAADAWAVDAGARYVEFEIGGRHAAAVLNSACSLDLREAVFLAGTCAQTLFARMPIVLFSVAPRRFGLLIERPLASHLWGWLCRALEDLGT